MAIKPQILSAELSTVVQVFSTVGDLDNIQFAALFQQILTIMKDPINGAIRSISLNIPRKILFFTMDNLHIEINDNYITATVDPTFIAPKGPEFERQTP